MGNKIQRFVNWDKFDFISGMMTATLILTSVFAYFGGATFRQIALGWSPIVPYGILFVVVMFCADKGMELMKNRKKPLIPSELYLKLSLKKIVAIGFFGNLAAISLFLIAIIITIITMATLNPEAFNTIMGLLPK